MRGQLRTRALLVISLCVCTRLATVQAQIVVGFSQAETTVIEGVNNNLQVTHTGSNVNNIDVTATPMTLAQFNESIGGAIGSLPEDVRDAIADIEDPAEYDSDPSGKRDFNNTPIAFTFTPGGDTFFNIRSEDIVFDDDINEATEAFIISLSITSANMDGTNEVELDEFDGILVVQVRDNDRIQLGFERTIYTFSEDVGNTADYIRIINQNNVSSEIDIPLVLRRNMDTSTADEGSGEDFNNLTTMYTFTPNDTEIITPITIVDDAVTEGDEVLALSLTTTLSSTIVSLDPASASITITDNDVVNVSFSDISLSASEGQMVTLTVQLMGEATINITVYLTTADGTATAPGDYTALVNERVVIPAGYSSVTTTLMINTNNEFEDDESFTVTMTSSDLNAQVVADMDQATVTIQNVVPATTAAMVTPTSTPSGETGDDGDDEGLSGGAVAGIVIGVLVFVIIAGGILVIIIFIILFFFLRTRKPGEYVNTLGDKKESKETTTVSVQKQEAEGEEPEVTIHTSEKDEKETQ